jgi:hypothetical protein
LSRRPVPSWRSAIAAGVEHSLLFGPPEGVGLVLESLCSAPPAVHQDDDGDVLRVWYQPRFHDVLAARQAPQDARGEVGSKGIYHRGWA